MSEDRTHDRREFLKKAGTVAWATPLILTLTTRSAHAQVGSCTPAGVGCGTWSPQLNACVPDPMTPLCCNSCERGTGEASMFCYCT